MLRWRLISGAALVALLVALCWLDARAGRPGIFLAPLVIALCVLATGELLQMFRARGGNPLAWAMFAGTMLPVLASCYRSFWPDGPLSRLGWLACGLAARPGHAARRRNGGYGSSENSAGKTTVNLALAALSILYLGGLLGFLIQLRLLPGAGDANLGLAAPSCR